MRIFAEHPLSEFLEQRRQAAVREIQSDPQDHLLNVNEADYVKYLAHKYHLEPVTFAFDATRASSGDKLIPAENHPPLFNVQSGQNYSRPVITLHVPFTGEPELLQCWPSSRIMWTCEVTIISRRRFPLPRGEGQGEGQTGSEIQFDLINWHNDPEPLHRDKQRILDNITQQNASVTGEVTQFNSRLEHFIRQTLSRRKSQLLTQLNVVGSLGVPAGVPQTFAVPIVPKKLVVKPSAPASARAFPSPSGCGDAVSRRARSQPRVRGEGQTGNPSPSGCGDASLSPRTEPASVRGEGQTGASPPDPTLDHETYQDILSIIHDLGVAMERHPSTYDGKHEQDLRDLFLATLSTHYPSTTGETFNKKGRTDILVRHQGSNVFVAECKFWQGLQVHHDTIDQLLSYLTWRDSKAALVYFIRITELAPILEVIATGTPQHPGFIRFESKRGESWMQCAFSLPSDPSRNVHLTVLSFHFPTSPERRKLAVYPRFQAPKQPPPS